MRDELFTKHGRTVVAMPCGSFLGIIFSTRSALMRARNPIKGFARFFSLLLLSAVFLAVVCEEGFSTTLSESTTDLWQGTNVTSDSGVLSGSDIGNMFGGNLGTVEPGLGRTLFRDGQPAGTTHFVEWQTPSAVTLQSFALFAAHDGFPRDANYRGFSSFELFAWNSGTSTFDSIFTYSPGNPYGTSVAPPNGFLGSNCTIDNFLCFGVNLTPVTTDRFRAEFVQFGDIDPNASGPRIIELDGFDSQFVLPPATPLQSATPLPAALPLFASGLGALGLLGWRRKRKAKAFAS
jgi:hypothetical protein